MRAMACWAVGVVWGVALVALFLHLSRLRYLHRTRLATSVVLLSRLVPADMKRLFRKKTLPPWVVFPRHENIDWLDLGIAKLWPFFGEGDCISSVIKWLESTLEFCKNESFTSFKINKFILGVSPPQISGMEKVDSKLDNIILEFDFQWIADPDIMLEVQTKSGSFFPVQITKVKFSGRFCLTFKPFAEDFPCIKAFTYSVRDLKALDVHVKGLPGVGYPNPSFLKSVKMFVKTAITASLVWPIRQIYKIVPGDYRDLELQVSGVLHVKVVEAKNLLNKDIVGKSDPFTTLYITHIPSRIKRTKTINNDLNPIWNETFRIEVEDLPTQSLFVKVFDDDGVQEAELLGCVKYELRHLRPGHFLDLWIPLLKDFDENNTSHHDSRGEIHLELCYVCSNEDLLDPVIGLTTPKLPLSKQLTSLERHFSRKELHLSPTTRALNPRSFIEMAVVRGVLSITVLQADDLIVKNPSKALNAYVLLKFKKSPAVLRTKVAHNTNTPEWNEVFHVVVEDALHEMILLELWNHKLPRNSRLGRCAVTVTCLLQHNNSDMEVELREANSGKVSLHTEWKPPAAPDPQFL